MYKTSFEQLSEGLIGIVRVGQDHNSIYDPWEWSCTVVIKGEVAELLAINKTPTFAQCKAGLDQLRLLGVTKVIFERIREDGRIDKREHRI